MKKVLDWEKPYHRFFEEMTRIPHGSFHEKAYSDYLVSFAKKHGFKYKQYPIGNVIIYKDASAGYEDHPTVVLQSHMDMVWEKTPDSKHNFETDPLKLYIEDGWLHAKGTTLGADDGTGVAYMLSVLDDDTMAHPPLECIFTVQEEVGLFGAYALEPEDIKGRRFISLDDGGGGIITTIAAAGGMHWQGTLSRQVLEKSISGYRLKVGGLKGGHSGECINLERGNALKICGEILKAVQKQGNLVLSSFNGGDKDNAIPISCTVEFVSDSGYEKVHAAVKQEVSKQKQKFADSDPDLDIQFEQAILERVWDTKASDTLLDFLTVCPTGLRHKSMKIEGLTTASENLASIKEKEDSVEISVSLRGAEEFYLDEMIEELRILGRLFGLKTEESGRYPAWGYEETSVMRPAMTQAVKTVMNKDLVLLAVHGGLECGVFKNKWPDMDMVTLGPVGKDVHTPDEKLDLESFDICYDLLKEFLRIL